MTNPIVRREFLKTLGISTAAAPFVPFLNRRAEAANGHPVRLLLVMSGNGSVWDQYWPDGGDRNLAFRPGSITEPLAPFRSKLIFPKNVSRQRSGVGGHEGPQIVLWTGSSATGAGYASGPSVDQIIAKRLPPETKFQSLQFAAYNSIPNQNRTLKTMVFSGMDSPLLPEASPYRMFDRLMLGGTSANFELLKAQRSSAIDLVRGELRRLTPQLDASDRLKLEQHLDGISAVQKRLMETVASKQMCPSTPTMKLGLDYKSKANFPELVRMQSELVVSALACDLTRVASLQWASCATDLVFSWIGAKGGGHHSISHGTDPASKNTIKMIETWYMRQLAYLLGRLDSIPEGSGTLLDNTLVLYANNLTDGAAHSCTPAITLIAGKAGGALKTSPDGRLVNLDGTDFTQLLATVCQAMNVKVDRVGNLGKPGAISSLLA